MTIERIHQEIKTRWNKLDSNHKKNLPTPLIDDCINKATDDFIEIFYAGSPKNYRLGFEVTQQRIDMLQSLVVPEKSYPVTLSSIDVYTLDLNTLDPKYRHFLRAYVIPTNCPSKKIPITIIRSNDLDVKLIDHNTKPSLTWNRCLGSIKNNNLVLYTNNYQLDNVVFEYLRQPAKVFFGGYDTVEYMAGDTSAYNQTSPQVTSDLHESYHDLLIDLTVQYIARILEDNNKLQLQQDQILNKV